MGKTHKLFYIFLVFAFILHCSPKAWTAEPAKITIKIPKNSQSIQLLGKKLVLVGNAKLPDSLDEIRDNWQDIQKKHSQTVFDINNMPLPKHHKQQWANLSKLLPNMKPLEKLRNINGFFNRIPSQKDAYTYKTKEHWATPKEFLEKRAGDCEDYAIAKYFALQYFSWPTHDLWIVFLRDMVNNGLHVVLATRHGETGFILDNLSKPAQLLIPEEQYAKQVQVIGVLNHLGMWLPLSNNK